MSQDAAQRPPRESTSRTVVAKTTEAAVSIIPIVGGPLAVVVATLFGYSFEKRLGEWREQVMEQIQRLTDERGIAIADLADNDEFLDALATATRTAETTSSSEKRTYLATALFNIGAGTELATDKQAIYLRYVEELTPSHMKVLALLNDPPAFLAAREIPWPPAVAFVGGSFRSIVEVALPDLSADGPLLDTVVDDLQSYGLAEIPSLNSMMSESGLRTGRGTRKGSEFIAFITPAEMV